MPGILCSNRSHDVRIGIVKWERQRILREFLLMPCNLRIPTLMPWVLGNLVYQLSFQDNLAEANYLLSHVTTLYILLGFEISN
jgi:hypothetical protein